MKKMFCFPPGSPSQHFLSTPFAFFYVFKLLHLKKRKTLYIKIKDGNPSIKNARQMRAQVDTIQRKNKSKQLAKNHVKTLCKEDPWLRNGIQ
jgi:hypothetical protein